MKRFVILLLSHSVAVMLGFAGGMYTLPILAALPSAPIDELQRLVASAEYRGQFNRDLEDSDWLHWGDGTVAVGRKTIALLGRIAPGPNYKLYLSPEFVETERDFHRVKPHSTQVGDVETFADFIVPVPDSVDVSQFKAVVIWCESFSQFITAAKYR